MNSLFFSITLLLSFSSYAIKPLVKLKNDDSIYACFNEIDTKTEKSFNLLIRNHKNIGNNFFTNREAVKNSVLSISMTKTRLSSSFGVAPLIHEGKDKLQGPTEGWSPNIKDDTIFTARGNLQALTIQKEDLGFYFAEFLQFANIDKPLVCTTNKEMAKELTVRAFKSDPFLNTY